VSSKVISLSRLIELLTSGPARVFNLPGGTLRPGSLGDVTLLDLEAEQRFERPFHSKAANTPFLGVTLQGRIAATVVGGVIKHDVRGAPASQAADAPGGRSGRRSSTRK
jgi:dihydroorotase